MNDTGDITLERCPKCGSREIHRSHRKNIAERALSLVFLPWRCDICYVRFFRGRWRKPAPRRSGILDQFKRHASRHMAKAKSSVTWCERTGLARNRPAQSNAPLLRPNWAQDEERVTPRVPRCTAVPFLTSPAADIPGSPCEPESTADEDTPGSAPVDRQSPRRRCPSRPEYRATPEMVRSPDLSIQTRPPIQIGSTPIPQ